MSGALGFTIDRQGGDVRTSEAAWNERKERVQEDVSDVEQQKDGSSGESGVKEAKKRPRVEKQAVWVDDDDGEQGGLVNVVERRRTRKFRKKLGERTVATSEYAQRIRDFYVAKVAPKTGGAGAWAELPGKSEVQEEEEGSESESDDGALAATVDKLLKRSGRVRSDRERKAVETIKARRGKVLGAGTLGISRLQNVNSESPNTSVTNCVEFHPSGRLVLTAGLDRSLQIFQVDGKRNAKIQGVRVADLQIASAHFTGGGDSVVVSGSQRHLYKLDLNSGAVVRHGGFGNGFRSKEITRRANDGRCRFVATGDGTMLAFLSDSGRVSVVAESSMQVVGTIHVSAQVAAAAFDPVDNHRLYTTTTNGVVQLWDARKMRCVDQHRDEGTVHATAVAASGAHYAVGADTGIVNVYEKGVLGRGEESEMAKLRTEAPKKALSNLTTSISDVTFNHDGKILAMASRNIKDAVRLVHVPTMSVFSNWPSKSLALRRVQCVAFSAGGGYMALGNDKGDAHLYRISAYAAN